MTAPRVLYYALGGGHGHVMRGLAVLRRLGSGTLIGPPALAPWAAALGVRYLSPPGESAAGWIETLLRPDLLLVDVFPRGVVGDLRAVLGRWPAWLVSRWVRPGYYLEPMVRAAIETHYEQLVWGEAPPAALRDLRLPQHEAGPILLRPRALARAAARRDLGVPAGRPLLLGIGSGDAARQARVCRLLGKVAARVGAALAFASRELEGPPPVVRRFPVARYLAGVDVVVAAAGYHAFHEASAAGVPAVFLPQGRAYDDQRARAAGARVADAPEALEAAVRALLEAERPVPRRLADGARALARLVERRVEGGVLPQEEVAAPA